MIAKIFFRINCKLTSNKIYHIIIVSLIFNHQEVHFLNKFLYFKYIFLKYILDILIDVDYSQEKSSKSVYFLLKKDFLGISKT